MEILPADGTLAALYNDRDFGTSLGSFGKMIHQFRKLAEGGSAKFVAGISRELA